jgi:hypothetical protein
MVRPAQPIHKTVFVSVNNPLTPMAETQLWVQQVLLAAPAPGVTGIVLAGTDRWLCLLEGDATQLTAMTRGIERQQRPRQWQVLMSDSRARSRMFVQQPVVWRSGCSLLEMAVFLNDLRRYSSRTQVWHVDAHSALALLEPAD